MTPQRTITLLRVLFVVFSGCIGFTIGAEIADAPSAGLFGGVAFGLVVVLADRLLRGISLRAFSSATFGMFVGFIFARLLLASNVLRGLSDDGQWIASLAVYVTFAYLGMMLAIRSNRDELSLIIPYVRFRRATVENEPLVVDSSVIIDGRLPELCATGFVSSSLVVPRFILEELQKLADSADPQKRERGRTALTRLEEWQNDTALSVTIHEGGAEDATLETDAKLVAVAKLLDARLLTNDANLSSIARLQGVAVLNLHSLGRALKPTVEAGRAVEIALVKEGREAHQAVGYLSDGTMIIVNHGRPQLGQTVPVVITTTLQTSAGRLYFAELKNAAPAVPAEPAAAG